MADELILVVEDNSDSAKLFVDVLPFYGFRVRHAADGDEALRLAPQLLPDVVLMDIHLPGRNGAAVMQAMKESPGLATTKFIAISASVMPQDRQFFRVAGFDDFHGKPIDMTSLVEQIRGLLARS